MYLKQQQLSILKDIKQECKKREGRFVKSRNNNWIYLPSKEYMVMKEKMSKSITTLLQTKRIDVINGMKEACNKVNRIQKAMEIATSKGKIVSHINGGKIILKNKTN